jgi:diguanylate cyclase (GGDEF)-like protein/PAS domain S-box-containing protein
LLVGILIVEANADWPGLFLAGFLGGMLARFVHGDPLVSCIGVTLVNSIECLVVASAIRYRVPDVRNPALLRKLSQTAVTSTLIACAISAALATVFVHPTKGSVWQTALQWYAGHVLGMVVIATLTLVAIMEGRRLLSTPGKRLSFLLGLGLVAIVTAAVFAQSRYPLLFAVPVAQLWFTLRQGWRGVVLGVLVLSIIAGIFTANAMGPLYLSTLSGAERVFLFQFFVGAICIVTWPVAVGRAHRANLMEELRRREAQYRLLAGNLRDLIVHLRADGTRLFVSESAREILGYEPSELMQARWDLVHPDDAHALKDALARVFQNETAEQVTFRALHKDGHFVWLEALAHRVDTGSSEPEIVYSGRDVTARVRAEAAQAESRRLMQAIADNVPAIIAYFNRNVVYEFANQGVGNLLGVESSTLIGRTLREATGEEVYRVIEPHVIAALCGERRTYERIAGERHYEVTFIPDIVSDGSVRGFFALSYDITERKLAEQTLDRLARRDALTGLPNRREFDERLQAAIEVQQKTHEPLILILIDVDHFKMINDSHGHHAGDAVLTAVAQRLQSCVFDVDLVARLGGDEFAILVEQNASRENAERIASRAIAAMTRSILIEDKSLKVTLSIGVSVSTNAQSVELFKQDADRALYAAKAAGRNAYRID